MTEKEEITIVAEATRTTKKIFGDDVDLAPGTVGYDAVACMERDREIDRKEVETTLDAAQRQIAELSASRDHWMLEHKAASERIKTLEVQLSDAEKAGRDRAGQLTERIDELEQE